MKFRYKSWEERQSHCRELARKSMLRNTYNLTTEEYSELLKNQNNKCKICGIVLINPHIDHDHNTGKVRSILCSSCNTGIGLLKEDKTILLRAIEYLDKTY